MQKEENPQSWLGSYSSVVSQSGNIAVGVASGASTAHVGGGLNGGGVGDKAVSIASGASTIFIGGNLSGVM